MHMASLILLDRLEEEYLVRVHEAVVGVRQMRQFFLWSQGQLQSLLPHHVMVCLQFGQADELVHIECVDRLARDAAFVELLCHAEHGLAVRLGRLCLHATLPLLPHAQRGPANAAAVLHADLLAHGLEHCMAHGTGKLYGGSSVFVLVSMPQAPGARQQYLFDLVLPLLQLAFLRVMAGTDAPSARNAVLDVLSARELEILTWVMHGKSNFEIGAILTISTLTVKNHLQKIYRKLNVHTRVQAVARCWDLQHTQQHTQQHTRQRPQLRPSSQQKLPNGPRR